MNIKGLMNKRVSDGDLVSKQVVADLESKIRQCVQGVKNIEWQKSYKGTYAYVYTKNTFASFQQLNDWIATTGAFDIEINIEYNTKSGLVYLFEWHI